ncbi:hypothetical protein KM043_001807 [Ampulex compressa]|nr:hypothetical protein KM043_001807 [Ampulex compressa]
MWRSRCLLQFAAGAGRGAGGGRAGFGGVGGRRAGQRTFGRSERRALGLLAGTLGTCGAILYSLGEPAEGTAVQGEIPALPRYPWKFEGILASLDHSALRRGWQVYRTVCATCHGLRYVRFADLVGVTHTAEEIKRIAAEYEVKAPPPRPPRRISRKAGASRMRDKSEDGLAQVEDGPDESGNRTDTITSSPCSPDGRTHRRASASPRDNTLTPTSPEV